MNLLISAYACAPSFGSDHGIAWTWITEAHRLGHKVWVFTSTVHKEAIQRACTTNPALAGIHWSFPKVTHWPLTPGVEPKYERTYNLLWQHAAAREAKVLLSREKIDAIHHASWVGVRAPTFMGTLGPPLVIGPIGGGETSPMRLRDYIGARGWLLEAIRDLSNWTISWNPIVRPGFRQAAAIFATTPETERLFRGTLRRKVRVYSMLAAPRAISVPPRQHRIGAPKLIYAGRLLYWKGVHIALRAIACLIRQHPDAILTIVGSGAELKRLQSDTRSLRIERNVCFMERVPQSELLALYDMHDLMIFPSLHDSGGMVVLEALSRGLPVVCLDLGGPGFLVTNQCGAVVRTAGRGTDDVASDMAAAVADIISSEDKYAAFSAAASCRAAEYAAPLRARALYQQVAEIVALQKAAPHGL